MPAARRSLAALGFSLALIGATAAATADEVGDLVALLRARPAALERDAWREQRREAARKLGELGDRRAVPALIAVVEAEQFDAIAEVAIVALGKLGDPSAAAVLRKVAADPSRDRYVRDEAKAALRRLGVAEGDDGETGTGGETRAAAAEVETGAATGASDQRGTASGPEATDPGAQAPALADDALAAVDRLTFALGGARASWDTAREVAALDADVAFRFESIRERSRLATRWGGQAALVAGAIDYEGAGSSSRAALATGAAFGEGRAYLEGGRIYGVAAGRAALALVHEKLRRPDGGTDRSDNRLGADLEVRVGAGRGRVLEVGEALRVRRLELALRRAGALGRPITDDLAARILAAWWTLRGERGDHRRLTTTVALLREAGVLLAEPDAGLTYQLLQILGDGLLDRRQAGLDVRVSVVETYLVRDGDQGDAEGRREALALDARFGRQSHDGSRELAGFAAAERRVLADDGLPSPWTAQVGASLRRHVYSDVFDPIGAVELGVRLGVSSDGADDGERAALVELTAGWLLVTSRASRYRLAGSGRAEAGELFVGLSFEAAYGLLDASLLTRAGFAGM